MTQLDLQNVLLIAGSGAFGRALWHPAFSHLKLGSRADERGLMQLLTEHRLQFLFFEGIKENALESKFSSEFRDDLGLQLRDSMIRSAAFEMAMAASSQALAAADLPVIACKGAVLSQHYYRTRGLRRMHDIDYWLIKPDLERCRHVLADVGFFEVPGKATLDARNFVDKAGIELDVHLRMRLFEECGASLEELCVLEPGRSYRVFGPEAMLAHLLTHLLGHAHETGILLCWLMDIVLVLNKHVIDIDRLRSLLRPDGSFEVFLRLLRSFTDLGFIDQEFGLERALEKVRPVNFESLVRQRRRSRFSGALGSFRLGRALLFDSERRSPLPGVKDLLFQPFDWLTEENPLLRRRGAMLADRK